MSIRIETLEQLQNPSLVEQVTDRLRRTTRPRKFIFKVRCKALEDKPILVTAPPGRKVKSSLVRQLRLGTPTLKGVVHREGKVLFFTFTSEVNKKNKRVMNIKEKPKKSKSFMAITGLYFFDNKVSQLSKMLKPSKRKELEIVDLLNKYRKKNKLSYEYLGRGGAWLDTGSIDDFYNTSAFVSALENRQGLKIACLEEMI